MVDGLEWLREAGDFPILSSRSADVWCCGKGTSGCTCRYWDGGLLSRHGSFEFPCTVKILFTHFEEYDRKAKTWTSPSSGRCFEGCDGDGFALL